MIGPGCCGGGKSSLDAAPGNENGQLPRRLYLARCRARHELDTLVTELTWRPGPDESPKTSTQVRLLLSSHNDGLGPLTRQPEPVYSCQIDA